MGGRVVSAYHTTRKAQVGRTSWVPVQSQEVLSKDVKMWGQVLSLVDGELYEI